MSKKIGVVLSGCGVKDGSEIHETVCTLLALDKRGIKPLFFAPDITCDAVDHNSGNSLSEKRSVISESARIARGPVKALSESSADEVDAFIFPGGFGAAKNLCSFATKGSAAEVEPSVKAVIEKMHSLKKPMGFICIAPVLAALCLGKHGIKLTIGNDPGTASTLEELGAHHISCSVTNAVYDETHKIVTTPAYMLGPGVSDIFQGIDTLVSKIIDIA